MSRSLREPKTSVKHISRRENEPRVYHAYLAEDYDGIGQYTLVSFAKSSVSAVLRARVAPGDFATGQTIPDGTPVTVFVYRGQAEILTLGAK